MKLHFDFRCLFAAAVIIAVLFAIPQLAAPARGAGRWPYAVGNAAFWLVLFMPTWGQLLLMDDQSRGKAWVRAFLAGVPSLWYVFLVVLAEHWRGIMLLRVAPVLGLLVVLPALALCARGWRRILVVPLAIAIVAATVSCEVAGWSVNL